MKKIILKFQLQVAFFHLFSGFYQFFKCQPYFKPPPLIFQKRYQNSVVRFCREFIDEENKENQKEIGVKIH